MTNYKARIVIPTQSRNVKSSVYGATSMCKLAVFSPLLPHKIPTVYMRVCMVETNDRCIITTVLLQDTYIKGQTHSV